MLSRLAAELGAPAALELMPAYHTFSGGNPLLLDALVEDRRLAMLTTPYLPAGEPVVGEAYRRAVLACVQRCGPVVAAVAAGVAVLGATASPRRLHRLTGLAPGAAASAVRVLTLAGLLQDGRFRHPAAPEAVLDNLPAVPRAELHLRALRLLRDEGVAGAVPPAGRADWAGQADWADRADRAGRADRTDRARRADWARRADRAGRAGRADWAGRADRAGRPAPHRAGWADRAGPRRAGQHAVAGAGQEPRGAAADLTGLTQAERRVAALAAVGNTNREIAHALFVTVSTVEQHLTRIYRKLNLRGRAELARCS